MTEDSGMTLGDILQAALDRQAAESVRLDQERKARSLIERHDDIIRELDRTNKSWWSIYPEASQIYQELLGASDTAHIRVMKAKRDIVAKHIIPTMYACIRVGWLEPKKQPKDHWDPK